jgi:hypothetical protein
MHRTEQALRGEVDLNFLKLAFNNAISSGCRLSDRVTECQCG